MKKYGKFKWEGLYSIKWMRWTTFMVDEMNGMDFGMWTQ